MCIDRLEQIRATTIDNNSMNERLLRLYEKWWDEYQEMIYTFENQGYELANIYLLAASDEYVKSEVKIMCLGKETQCWGGEFTDSPTIKELQQLYTLYTYHEKGNGAAFQRFANWMPTISDNIAVIPNNIVKIGKKATNGYYTSVAEVLHSKINLLKEEIAILQPSFIICPTSNLERYNEPLCELLGNNIESVVVDQDGVFVSVRFYDAFPNTPLIVCPHPQGKSVEQLELVKEAIISIITKTI